MSKCKFGNDCPECVKDKCSRYRIYEQGRAEALDIDMDKPMHFTDEQKAWIKNYIIINAKRQRVDAIDECINTLTDFCGGLPNNNLINALEQLKERNNE